MNSELRTPNSALTRLSPAWHAKIVILAIRQLAGSMLSLGNILLPAYEKAPSDQEFRFFLDKNFPQLNDLELVMDAIAYALEERDGGERSFGA